MRTQVSRQQSDCETGIQLTDVVEGRLEDKEDRRYSLTTQNGTYRCKMVQQKWHLQVRNVLYTHTQENQMNRQ